MKQTNKSLLSPLVARKSDAEDQLESGKGHLVDIPNRNIIDRLPDKVPFSYQAEERGSSSNTHFDDAILGRKLSNQVPSNGHWNLQTARNEPSLIRFTFFVPHGTSIGIYGARNRTPSHTRYDFMEIIGNNQSPAIRVARSSSDEIIPSHSHSGYQFRSAEFTKFLDKGIWYISIFNDASHPSEIAFIMTSAGMSNQASRGVCFSLIVSRLCKQIIASLAASTCQAGSKQYQLRMRRSIFYPLLYGDLFA